MSKILYGELKRNIGEIIPKCEQCGQGLDTDEAVDSGWSRHEENDVKCDECGYITILELEYCFFTRN